ncbi:4Fe-4S dicluster domain-containing protein [Lutibacter sp.]|uniref:4Fe-4S dicluster domain-containing protein n=1 Tax=Lutibacter sp. TaxID=1925666 RepID=UPI0025BB4E3A|nr:4Fe-4S dicluster domain-containing protein [Lutibacter sp.]MCF6182679.1 4Fe-4S dicluster domain-containing protein [Lutibacter sp.]
MGNTKKNDRRDFLSKFGTAFIAGAALSPLISNASELLETENNVTEIKNFKGSFEDLLGGDYTNIKLRMQDDVRRALKKPMKDRKWAMAIDLRKCVGCNACTVACIAENALPPGVVYRPVIKEEIGTYPNVSKINLPKPCMQCDEPPCVDVCPVEATWKREDGIVVIDYEACIGCRYCMTACPYEHRMFDFGEKYSDGLPLVANYDKRPSFEYGKEWDREDRHSSPIGNVRKCTFCAHRLDEGLLPQCLTTCIGGANYFGDLNDEDSVIAKLVSRLNVFRLKEEMGTEPNVYYIR